MAIISLGIIDKKLLYPAIYIVIYALIHIYRFYNESNIVIICIENTGIALGLISTIFINCAFNPKYFIRKIKWRKNILNIIFSLF